MNTARFVDSEISRMKSAGMSAQEIVWSVALLCVGWSYVYSAWGAECTPSERRKRYNLCPSHKTIKTKCKGFDSGDCSGCQWYPDGNRTRCYDCRGFTDWCLKQVGFDLYGDTCSAQWNHAANWKAKGDISSMPKDTLCCLFVKKDGKWTHTGFGLNNETVECSSGVQHFTTRNKKWTNWAVPACIGGDIPTPTPTPTTKPTLRRGDRGEYVTLAQTELINKGYSCGSFGADGSFGAATEKAVREFQKDHTDENDKPLTIDGVIGQKTWWALDSTEPATTYTVSIPHLSNSQADALIRQYPNATKTEERG